MKKNPYTVKIGPTVFHCPKCRGLLYHYCQPVNVHVYACTACGEAFDPMYVKGFEDGLTRSAELRNEVEGAVAGESPKTLRTEDK